MEQATNHDDMVRAQAKAQLLRQLLSPYMEQTALARYQHINSVAQPYMSTDAYGTSEETQ